MRIAVVDIGTNSTRLLVAEWKAEKVRVIKTDLVMTRLGEGIGKRTGLLKPAIERTIEALLDFKQIIREMDGEKVIVVATSAVRDAANRQKFLSAVKKQVGWDVRVLSGSAEAELSYLGVVKGLKTGVRHPLVIDIGGGSTEFIWVKSDGLYCLSVNLGAVRMTENASQLTEIREMLAGLFDTIKEDGINGLVGVGGTLTTLAAIDLEMEDYEPAQVHGYYLKRQRIKDILHRLELLPLEERKKIPGLQPRRADIIVTGAKIALAVVEGLDLEGVIVSETDIMYGLLYQTLETGE